MKSPFTWFGGKNKIASMVWQRFGDVRNFVEPFYGSGAVHLNRPQPFEGSETVNDYDGLVCNFWRAVKADPEGVAKFAGWPVMENDLHARHIWLVNRKDSLQATLEGDPDFFDTKIAGWWVWGLACWIGSGFCAGQGPWHVVDGKLVRVGNAGQGVNRKLVHLGDAGQGVKRRLVHLGNSGQGVNRKLVHLGDAGQGVNRKLVHLGDAGKGDAGDGVQGLLAWMEALSARLARVRVCCGDWSRVCGDAPTVTQGLTAVFLDPPYADTAKRYSDIYRVDSESVAHAVREWAIAHGDDKRMRIALCGYAGEHVMPGDWECVEWQAHGGYSNLGKSGPGRDNRRKERIWFSPHCVAVSEPGDLQLFAGA